MSYKILFSLETLLKSTPLSREQLEYLDEILQRLLVREPSYRSTMGTILDDLLVRDVSALLGTEELKATEGLRGDVDADQHPVLDSEDCGGPICVWGPREIVKLNVVLVDEVREWVLATCPDGLALLDCWAALEESEAAIDRQSDALEQKSSFALVGAFLRSVVQPSYLYDLARNSHYHGFFIVLSYPLREHVEREAGLAALRFHVHALLERERTGRCPSVVDLQEASWSPSVVALPSGARLLLEPAEDEGIVLHLGGIPERLENRYGAFEYVIRCPQGP